eukprot:1161712-Pelagomonas_calceolata.AAC.2
MAGLAYGWTRKLKVVGVAVERGRRRVQRVASKCVHVRDGPVLALRLPCGLGDALPDPRIQSAFQRIHAPSAATAPSVACIGGSKSLGHSSLHSQGAGKSPGGHLLCMGRPWLAQQKWVAGYRNGVRV